MHIQEWLETIPAVSVYLLVGLVIGLESLGIPLPGEIILVSSALLASQHGEIDPVVLGLCAITGAIVGDSIGYAIGRRGGKPLLEKLGRRFPKHFGPEHVALAERSFDKWGMWAVFFGRFVALLRIFAGPLAGVLRMPYWRFLVANILGGILWAGGTTAVIYSVGIVAEPWLKRFSWLALAVALLFGLAVTLVVRGRMKKAAAQLRETEFDVPAGRTPAARSSESTEPSAAPASSASSTSSTSTSTSTSARASD
ncbi:DedA family protein [Streptomyces sp. H27-H5]|uniref:DedA family protein n=1 Tax=Streptomyces sp. H27-H5 TaxID=2996460 RepID=UPI00226E0507|nr:DedA family protein [Streptomyces sp. H27-H5]MCY0958294.1 DedA family protein [Streptomyces sp. H27-H5]